MNLKGFSLLQGIHYIHQMCVVSLTQSEILMKIQTFNLKISGQIIYILNVLQIQTV